MNDDWVILGGALTPPWDEEVSAAAQSVAKSRLPSRGTLPVKGGGRARQRFAEWLEANPPSDLGPDEVQAHLRCMPDRYWKRVNETELPWHLSTIHAFFQKLIASDAAVSPVAADWRQPAGLDLTRVVVCSWDRRGLLEQIAAAFSALRIGIHRADVYTRTDSLVLDVFDITESDGRPIADDSRLEGLSFLVEGAFCNPPRFASVWATEFHKVLPKLEKPAFDLSFDNRKSPDQTGLCVEAPDRPGLLYDLVRTLTEQGLQISQAIIDTQADVAKDQFLFTDEDGRKVTSTSQLRQLRKELVSVITS